MVVTRFQCLHVPSLCKNFPNSSCVKEVKFLSLYKVHPDFVPEEKRGVELKTCTERSGQIAPFVSQFHVIKKLQMWRFCGFSIPLQIADKHQVWGNMAYTENNECRVQGNCMSIATTRNLICLVLCCNCNKEERNCAYCNFFLKYTLFYYGNYLRKHTCYNQDTVLLKIKEGRLDGEVYCLMPQKYWRNYLLGSSESRTDG